MLVLGDAMADWLAYGLEDAYSEQPDMGVIRKHKTVSGLIKYQPKGEPADWAAAAKGILATEKPDAIVVMLGLNDRVGDARTGGRKKGREEDRQARKTRANRTPSPADKPAAKPDDAPIRPPSPTTSRPMPTADDADDAMRRRSSRRRKARAPATGLHEFRDERWVELYGKKIEELIAVLKSKGVPVLWVGLPADPRRQGRCPTCCS